MRALLVSVALLGLVSCAAPAPPGDPVASAINSVFASALPWIAVPPGPGRVTLSNFVYDRARVETFVTSFPDCQLRVGMMAMSFELPLNGTRVIDTPAGSDVCWRRIEPPFAEATIPGVPLATPWNRAFTTSGRIVDARL
jgi:hypothetical protein